MRRRVLLLFCVFLALAAAPVLAAKPPTYAVEYRVGFLPADGLATVAIRIEPGTGTATRLRFSVDPEAHTGFEGDGRIEVKGDRVTWRPPQDGGEFRYRYRVDRRRASGGYDARMTRDWALFRADRLVPPTAVIAPDGAVSTATLRFDLPPGWTNVDTSHRMQGERTRFAIVDPDRRFLRPVGWIIAGDVGTRREQIEGMEVSVAAPKGDAMRRQDVLAFVNTTAAEMRHAFGTLPEKLLIVGAGDPMWRGGLSGPRSLFLHADRPLISENATSTLIHELTHVVTRVRGADDDDWIAEGFAEFYSIELMRRTGLISEARADKAFAWMANHGRKVKTLRSNRSAGPRTARAVGLFRDLDRELQSVSDGRLTLDDLAKRMVERRIVSRDDLREDFKALTGRSSKVLQTTLLAD